MVHDSAGPTSNDVNDAQAEKSACPSTAITQTNSYPCTICKRSFSRMISLKSHLESHNRGKPYVCSACPKAFSRNSTLTQHLKAHSEKPFACDTCGNRFRFEAKLKIHKLLHSKGKMPFVCNMPQCGRGFAQQSSFNRHLEGHNKRRTCPKCQKELSSQVQLDLHLRNTACSFLPMICSKCRTAFKEHSAFAEHLCVPAKEPSSEDTLFCSECDHKCQSRSALIDHFYAVHQRENSAFCDECNRVYCSADVLKKHIRRVHCGDKPFTCSTCNKGHFTLFDLKRHLRRHSGLKPFSCKTCDKSFSNHGELTAHSELHKKAITCPDCGKQYTAYYSLHKHIQKAHSEKPVLTCPVCERAFSSESDLQTHQILHSALKEVDDTSPQFSPPVTKEDDRDNDVPNACQECNKEFPTRAECEQHLHIHPTKKTNVCSQCGRRFVDPAVLKQHELYCKSRSRPYPCSVCSQRFWTSSSQRAHMLLHFSKRAIFCHECHKSFLTADSLKAHLAMHETSKFVCPMCRRVFSDLSSLTRHFHTHYRPNRKLYDCDQCDKNFVRFNSLRAHMLKRHRSFEFVEC